jgi:HprK-related kinase B
MTTAMLMPSLEDGTAPDSPKCAFWSLSSTEEAATAAPTTRESLQSFIHRIWQLQGVAAWSSFRFGDKTVLAGSNNPVINNFLDRYFHEFRRDPAQLAEAVVFLLYDGPVETIPWPVGVAETELQLHPRLNKLPKEAFVDLADGRIVRSLHTSIVYMLPAPHLALPDLIVGPCSAQPTHLLQLATFICKRYLRAAAELPVCHAAGIIQRQNGKSCIIAGIGGAGKSTLSLGILSQCADINFQSNDRIHLDFDRVALHRVVGYGLPRQPCVNPGTLLNNPSLRHVLSTAEREHFDALPSQELWAIEAKKQVVIDQVFGSGRFQLTGEIAAIIILCWERPRADQPPVPAEMRPITLADRPELVQALIKAPSVYVSGSCRPVGDIVQLLADLPIYEIVGTVDFDFAQQQIITMLQD